MHLEADQLKTFCPAALTFRDGLQQAVDRFQIDTRLRLCHWLAQAAFESAGFRTLVENLNYTRAETIAQIFRRYFDRDGDRRISAAELETARGYVRQPQRLANFVYANRMGNGDVASGDGWKHRGHGPFQLTGANNQRAYSLFAYGDDRVLRDPSMLTRQPDAGLSAGWFWHVNGINRWADADNLKAVSGLVNTGSITGIAHGLDDGDRSGLPNSRADWLHRAKGTWK